MITTECLDYDKETKSFVGEISDFMGRDLDEVDGKGYRGVYVKSLKTGSIEFFRYMGTTKDSDGEVTGFEFLSDSGLRMKLFND